MQGIGWLVENKNGIRCFERIERLSDDINGLVKEL